MKAKKNMKFVNGEVFFPLTSSLMDDSFTLAILKLSDLFESVNFQYKPKRKNQMSHKLARVARNECVPLIRKNLIESSYIENIKN